MGNLPFVRPGLNGEVVSDADIPVALFGDLVGADEEANGIVMPSDFAVLRSMTVANVAG